MRSLGSCWAANVRWKGCSESLQPIGWDPELEQLVYVALLREPLLLAARQ
ncbi:MAG: hypothetical protein L3K07_03820 [Thermoplasmata archaeon]|nr:hypothetical protein [Thermoplasmata archaeon]